jgi:hypothetical protein
VRSLTQIGPAAKDAVPALIRVLSDDRDMTVRAAAADALAALGPAASAAVPTLIRRTSAGTPTERTQAAEALTRITAEAGKK